MDRDEITGERPEEADSSTGLDSESETHATTGGAAAAGAVTGGVIGLAGGPVGAAIGAVGGAIVGAAAERMMHAEEETAVVPTPTAEESRGTPVVPADETLDSERVRPPRDAS